MSETKFLNVDLDLHAESGLKELRNALGPAVIELKRENKSDLTIEIMEQPESIDEAIVTFCNLINSLPVEIRAIWDKCDVRSMNIGIQAGTTPHAKSFHLSNRTLTLLLSINVDVLITVYAVN